MKGQPDLAARATAKPCEEDDDDNGDGVIDSRTTFEYDDYGREIKDVWYSTSTSPDGEADYTWDDHTGRITDIDQKGFGSGSDSTYQDESYHYDAEGHLIESIDNGADTANDKATLWVDYKQWNFDALGNAQNTSFYDQAQLPAVTDTDVLTFDAKGRQTDDEKSMNGILWTSEKTVFDDSTATSVDTYVDYYLYGTDMPAAQVSSSTTTTYDGAGHPILANSTSGIEPGTGTTSAGTEVWVWDGDQEISDTSMLTLSDGTVDKSVTSWKYECPASADHAVVRTGGERPVRRAGTGGHARRDHWLAHLAALAH